MIEQQSIDEILNLDITEVIGKYITLKRKGTNHQACCPFHKEKTPSFSVSPAKGFYKCFGCGKAGNVIGFVMDFKKLDYISAIKAIAANHNITLVETIQSKESKGKYDHNERLYLVNKLALGWFQENLMLKENVAAHLYAQSRWNDEMISEFGIGFAPDKWDGLKIWAKNNNIKEDILIEIGLLSESKGKRFDYFRGRIIFPIFNLNGRIIGFTGRDFSGKKDAPKYFNTPHTDIFTKGKNLYGFHSASRSIKEKGVAYLVEGNADVIRLHQIGKINAIGSGGTSLTRDQISELKR